MITILPNYYNTWENLLSAIYTNTITEKKKGDLHTLRIIFPFYL